MKTLKLEINNKVYDKIIWLLNQFDKKDVKIVDDYTSDKQYLNSELKKIDSDKATFISLNELDAVLEERISDYES